MLKEKIQQLAKQYAPDFISIRHHLHAHPELSYQEFQTSKFVQQKLTEIGVPFQVMAGAGVVGLLKGKNPDKRVGGMRGGMDGLAVEEGNDIPYKAIKYGAMTDCGHH